MMRWRRDTSMVVFGVCLFALVLPALAEEGAQGGNDVQARRAQSLTRSLMSPFCPGKTLAACPSPNAQTWREEIRAWVAEGASNEDIERRLAARAPGFDLHGRPGGAWSWGVPLFGVLLASIWLAFVWRRARQIRGAGSRGAGSEAPEAGAAATAGSDQLDRRLREELESFDG